MKCGFIFLLFTTVSIAQVKVNFEVKDTEKNPIADAYVFFSKKAKLTNNKGIVSFIVDEGNHFFEVTHIAYNTHATSFDIEGDTTITITLTENKELLQEVVVTAKESDNIATTSVIGRSAMSHIQPSSFSDVISLLPGKNVSAPVLNSANHLTIREVGIGASDYSSSSLGISFVMDDIPINSNANMQQTVGLDLSINPANGGVDEKRRSTRSGVDMRAITTDGIEKIEVVRGVASAKYGDLSSGLVNIKRKKGYSRWNGRIKSDGFSKLFHLGKGFYFDEPNLKLNFDVGYLNAKSDPRNYLENYNRYTASARMEKVFETYNPLTWNLNIDYTGTLDSEKTDPDIGYDEIDSYKSSYNNIRISNKFNLDFSEGLLRNLNLRLGLSQSYDKIKQIKFVQPHTVTSMPISTEAGESYGVYLPPSYVSDLLIDGKPLDIFSDFSSLFKFTTFKTKNELTAGVNYSYSKNNGLGQVYDPALPPTPGISIRPRAFKDIPAMQSLAFYLEDVIRWSFGKTNVTFQAGVRANTLVDLNEKYQLQGKFYFDPRLNIQFDLPDITFANKKALEINVSGGYGKQSKLPTQNMLYPQNTFIDYEQLNYYHNNEAYRQLHYKTYSLPNVNYAIVPAINQKKEVRLGLKYDYHSLYITAFKEDMTSGFRRMDNYHLTNYKKYNTEAIDPDAITEAPLVEDLPYETINALALTSTETNGSKINKKGIEFQYSGKRFEVINTRFTFSGAWLETKYANSLPYLKMIYPNVIGGKQYFYTGVYENQDNYSYESFQSSITADTFIPLLNLTTSLRVDLNWYTHKNFLPTSSIPIEYINEKGEVLPYTENEANDPVLQGLILDNNNTDERNTPFYLNTHIKISKQFYKYFTLSMYVNDLLNYYEKNNTSSGVATQRTFTAPYFGMEMNIKF